MAPCPPLTFTTAWTCWPSVKLAVKFSADKVVVPFLSVTVLLATLVVPWYSSTVTVAPFCNWAFVGRFSTVTVGFELAVP